MKSFIRFLSKHKLYALAEIIGLGVALAFVILAGSFVIEDNRCDRSTKNADRLFLLFGENAPIFNWTGNDDPVRNRIMQLSPVEEVVTLFKAGLQSGPMTVDSGTGEDYSIKVLAVSDSFFDVFGYTVNGGNPSDVLKGSNSAVISESFAERAFGENAPMGALLKVEEGFPGSSTISREYLVTGIYSNPGKTVIPYADVIIRYDTYAQSLSDESSISIAGCNFVLMKEGFDAEEAKKAIAALDLSDLGPLVPSGPYQLVKMKKLHHRLYDEGLGNYFENLSDYDTFKIFLLACAVLLLFAVLNYIMLSIAFSRFRLTEMATRRLLGTSLRGVIARCFAESYLLLGTAFFMAVILALALRGTASDILELEFSPLSTLRDWALVAVSFVLIGFVSGIFPAISVSKHEPVAVIKGETRTDDKVFFGKIVILLQGFVCTAIVSVCAAIFLQTEKMIHAPRGYNPDNVITMSALQFMQKGVRSPVSRDELASLSFIESMGFSSTSPAKSWMLFALLKGSPEFRDNLITMSGMVGTSEAFNLLEMEMVEDFHVEGQGLLRLYVCKSSWDEFQSETDSLPLFYGKDQVAVAGIIEDIKIGEINSSTMDGLQGYLCNDAMGAMATEMFFKVNGSEKDAIRNIRKLYEDKEFPDVEISSLNQQLSAQYETEHKYFTVLLVFGLLAILLTFMGLVALSSYWAQLRTKDTAVRKIFGCPRRSVYFGTVRSFIFSVMAGSVAAVPFAYSYVGHWLEHYLVRIDNSLLIYLSAVMLVLLTVLVAISVQAVRLMNTNPVKSLKSE